MLSDSKFIENSLISNLYYLRTLREFCARVQLSLPSNYKEYIDIAGKLAKQCEELGSKIMKYANRNIPSVALNSDIFVTPYTLRLEELTNKLFAYDINTDITKQELALEPEIPKPNPELIQALEEINQEALNIANEFITEAAEVWSENPRPSIDTAEDWTSAKVNVEKLMDKDWNFHVAYKYWKDGKNIW